MCNEHVVHVFMAFQKSGLERAVSVRPIFWSFRNETARTSGHPLHVSFPAHLPACMRSCCHSSNTQILAYNRRLYLTPCQVSGNRI